MVPDASSSVQLCVYVNLFSSPLGPQVADSAPHVPALHSSGPPQSVSVTVSLSDPGISSCTKPATHPSLFSPSPSLPPADRLVCTHLLSLLVGSCPPPPKKKKIQAFTRGGAHVRFSSPLDSSPQRVRAPSISPGVDVGL